MKNVFRLYVIRRKQLVAAADKSKIQVRLALLSGMIK